MISLITKLNTSISLLHSFFPSSISCLFRVFTEKFLLCLSTWLDICFWTILRKLMKNFSCLSLIANSGAFFRLSNGNFCQREQRMKIPANCECHPIEHRRIGDWQLMIRSQSLNGAWNCVSDTLIFMRRGGILLLSLTSFKLNWYYKRYSLFLSKMTACQWMLCIVDRDDDRLLRCFRCFQCWMLQRFSLSRNIFVSHLIISLTA